TYDALAGVTASQALTNKSYAGSRITLTSAATLFNNTAPPTNGTVGAGLLMSSTPNFGVIFGVSAPTVSMATGSLYLRDDAAGSGGPYYNAGGTSWTQMASLASLVIRVSSFTASATWTPNSNMVYSQLECWGGGGGGGGSANAAANVNSQGGGGGAGSYSRKT